MLDGKALDKDFSLRKDKGDLIMDSSSQNVGGKSTLRLRGRDVFLFSCEVSSLTETHKNLCLLDI